METIAFAGGGTGGHIFPGLAVIDELRSVTDCRVIWIGSTRGMDRAIVEDNGIEFFGISSGKLRRYFSISNAIDVFRILAGIAQSIFILARARPSLLFSKGGFVSVPPCMAARLLRIPVITHECDYSPGLATRLNSRFAESIFVSYEETRDLLPPKMRKRVTVTGNPVRPRFYGASAARGRSFIGCDDASVPVLLIQGGSLGAHQVNELAYGALERLCRLFFVVHQTGSGNARQALAPDSDIVRERYRQYEFIRGEMADVLACADVVVARSGANTVWECAAAGKPMVLVPLEKGASRGDQVENAMWFVSKGAAVMLTGTDATPERLYEAVERIASDGGLRERMSANASALGSARPAAVIAALIASRLGEKTGRNT